MNQETKTCQNCKNEFIIEPDDFGFYEKIGVPVPMLCPDCRYQRRIANRNEWNFYHRECDLCHKKMVSIYNPSYKGLVYCQPCFWSDDWDPLEYGRDFDFSRSFFEQFKEHRFGIPRIALANEGSINSEYTNQSNNNKNCYMCVATNLSENSMYGNWIQNSKECVDCWNMKECEIMYESLDCLKCYGSAFLETCVNTHNCYFGFELHGCNDCFGCINLRNKSYCWFNEQLTKEEYKKRLDEVDWTNIEINKYRQQLQKLQNKQPVKYYHGNRIVNSTGDYIGFNRNTRSSFNSFKNDNLSYGQDAWEARDCRDMTETLDNELDYEMEGAGWSSGSIVSCKNWYSPRVSYSELTFSSSDLFGCVSIKTKKHCIFNKQYSKEEYLELKDKIIKHMKKTNEWGEFFPIEISPFPYNDTVAQDYFPLIKEEVLNKGWRWYDRQDRDYKITKRHDEIVGTIDEVTDDIVNQVISCKSQDSEESKKSHISCATAFRVTPAELQFYRKMKLPIPDRCFPCRLRDRLNRRNPRKLYSRQCVCDYEIYKNTAEHSHHKQGRCPHEFETSYAPDRKEIVYCEKCYQAEVV
ncbi:MAG: hypothetical protein ABH833_00520 [Parcubacteria group bacterium]